MPRSANQRPVLSLPYDPRLPSITKILHRRHCALLRNDPNAREYLEKPPMVCPTYVGITGEGEDNSFTKRLGQHMASATNPCQVDTVKPIGRHFRLPGHEAQRDMMMLPIELIRGSEIFLRRARGRFNIIKFKCEKRKGVTDLEHGLNLDPGQ